MFKHEKTEAEDKFYEGRQMVAEDHSSRISVSSSRSRPRKVRIRERKIPDLNLEINSDGEEKEEEKLNDLEPQDADYSDIPQLLYELEVLILARIPWFDYWKLHFLNRQFSLLLKSGELFKVRKEIGFTEPSVFMLSSGDTCWRSFDREFKTCRKLPKLPSDECFSWGDKESVCAGTHLIVSGREVESVVVWRYELETNKWQKGPSMITPRCLFASATRGTCAFVAGGIRMKTNGVEVLNTAEKYDAETKMWVSLPRMHKRRNFCSGCYLDNKFYAIGGRNEKGEYLTCGESYDEGENRWELKPDMLKDTPFSTFQSPPLIAVVNNELYSLETCSNELRVYVKSTKTWKKLGLVPVRANKSNGGWGVAFKSLGNELLVIGASSAPSSGETMAVYTCCPGSNEDELQWKEVYCSCNVRLNHFILNCSVMVA